MTYGAEFPTYPVVRAFCLAQQPGVIDFPARCFLDKGHTPRTHKSARYGTKFETTIWEDDERSTE